jgi:hypothetical protein
MLPENVRTAADAREIVEERKLDHVKVGVFDNDGIMRGKYMGRDGIVTPRGWDQTHTVNGAVAWRVRGWDFNVATVLRTGWPTTRLTLAGVRDGVPVVATARRNAERVGRYSSTDFRATRELQFGRAKVAAFAEIGNLFDHVNRCCTEYEIETEDDETVLELSPIRYLPRVVSLGFIASF